MADQKTTTGILSLAVGDISTWTVLIVDDEPDNLAIAKKLLTYGGATVHTARNGVEGLQVLKGIKPSFILLDLSMPEMDGWEMFSHVRAEPATQHIPVIALTAHAMAGDREKVMQAGFDGYVAKPFRLSTFMTELLRCFREINGMR